MKSTRRGFFGMVAGLFAAPNLSILPERHVAPITVDWLTRETIRTLQNSFEVQRAVNGEYGEFFHPGELKVGHTIMIRKPARFTVQG